MEICEMDWIPIAAHCRKTGDTPAEVDRRIVRDEWASDIHYRRDSSGALLVNSVAFNAWVQGETPPMPAPKQVTDQVALYRCFDRQGRLLYVGISFSALIRLKSHVKQSAWAYKVARIDVEWLADRQRAADAERAAIRAERPMYNIVHSISRANPRAKTVRIERQ